MNTFAANQIYRIMYSSEDLERFKNKVPYNIFQKWFKDTRKKIVEVQVDGAPERDYP